MSDPYTLVHDGLWAVLEDNTDFTTLVPELNRIKFSGTNRSPIKDKITTADTPDVRISMKMLTIRESGTSNGEFDRVQFNIELATGDQRLTARAFPIVWAIRQALFAGDDILNAIEFNAKTSWILCAEPGNVDFGIANDAENRGIVGWAAVASVEFQLFFSKTDLTP